MFAFFSKLIGAEAGTVFLFPLTIIICAAITEDITTIVVALLAADGVIEESVAFTALYAGIMLGDLMLYGIGRLIRTHPKLARYIEHDFTARLKHWLDGRYRLTIFSGHFVPGLRSTTYIASGFFGYPLRAYLPSAFAGGFALLSALFSLAFWFGNLTRFFGPARWVIAVLFVIGLILVGRHNLRAYQTEQNAEPTE